MPKSKDEFVTEHFHLLFGMVAEALTWSGRNPDDLSRTLRGNQERIRTLLRQAYDDLVPPAPIPVEGANPKPSQAKPANPPAAPRGGPPGVR